MKKSYRNLYIYGLIFLSLLGNAGCNLANTKAEQTNAASANVAQIEAKYNNDTAAKTDSTDHAESQITPASVAGTYEYDTYKNGEGYDNELEIKDAGDGKLYVFLSGSYIYRIGETQSMHEAEGKGDARLRGNTANATLVDEAGKPCRATIAFNKNEATVKIPDTCQFNIALDGVYKKASSKSVEKPANTTTMKTREVSFGELADLVNDFDRHKAGERYVVTDVPANKIGKNSRADEFGNSSYKNLFYLQATDDEGDVANGFLTSAAMVKSLATNAEYEPATLRVTAVLIESNGKFDVYRMSFVTKIEGLNDDGSVLWTATGTEPAKVKFTH